MNDLDNNNLFDYKNNPIAYEIEEKARPDEMKMIDGVTRVANMYLNGFINARILDLCCGTGLPLIGLVNHKNIKDIIGVDISNEYLDFARDRFKDNYNIKFIDGDALDTELPLNSWDIIILSSAYHHIENTRKRQFFTKVSSLLSKRGVAIIGENILPPYKINDIESYKDSVRLFYNEVIFTAEKDGKKLPNDVRALIERVAKYGFDGEYEYKVSLDIMLNDIKSVGLHIIQQEKIWPYQGSLCLTTGGNYVITVSNNMETENEKL